MLTLWSVSVQSVFSDYNNSLILNGYLVSHVCPPDFTRPTLMTLLSEKVKN